MESLVHLTVQIENICVHINQQRRNYIVNKFLNFRIIIELYRELFIPLEQLCNQYLTHLSLQDLAQHRRVQVPQHHREQVKVMVKDVLRRLQVLPHLSFSNICYLQASSAFLYQCFIAVFNIFNVESLARSISLYLPGTYRIRGRRFSHQAIAVVPEHRRVQVPQQRRVHWTEMLGKPELREMLGTYVPQARGTI